MLFHVAHGSAATPASAGTVWLFHYGWGTLDSVKLAEIGCDPLRISITPEWRDSVIPPNPQSWGCVAAIKFPGPIWYRTPDMTREDLLRDLEASLWALGSRHDDPSGARWLVLPEHPARTIRFFDLEDRPAAHREVDLSIYLTTHNHCGVHYGLPVGRFTTNDRGEIALRAPLVDLYLDGLQYYEDEGDGPWGRMFSSCSGLRLGSAPVEVVRKAWELSDVEVSLSLADSGSRPVEGVSLLHCVRSRECGVHCGSFWRTDSLGVVRASFPPGSTESLTLKSPEVNRPLTDDEIRELFQKGGLAIRLRAP